LHLDFLQFCVLLQSSIFVGFCYCEYSSLVVIWYLV
jgi:hypothetical protein